MSAPSIPVDELPPIDELWQDVGFKLRLEYELQRSVVVRQLSPEFKIRTLVTWALFSFHPDGKKPAELRALRMETEHKNAMSELSRLGRIEMSQGVEDAKQVAAYRHEVNHRVSVSATLGKTKHFGVTWQAIWLVLLETVVGRKTGWTDQEVMSAVTEFVTIALKASRTRVWFEENRLRDMLRLAMKHFREHPSNQLQLLKIKSFGTRIESDPLLYLKHPAS
jgi:hypothetical protein